MSLARDLLEQSFHLAAREPKRPKQASLKRAVSSAYYALFHLLIHDAASGAVPRSLARLRDLVERTLGHADMKNVCKGFVNGNNAYLKSTASGSRKPFQTGDIPRSTQDLLKFPFDKDLIFVLKAFVELQEARHQADYDRSSVWSRRDVLTKIELARDAFDAWGRIKTTPNATVFKFALLFQKYWGR